MDLILHTKFSNGDGVFAIFESAKSNDWYCSDTCWRMLNQRYLSEPIKPMPVSGIRISIDTTSPTKIYYIVDGVVIPESDTFATLDEAKKACNERNGDDFYEC